MRICFTEGGWADYRSWSGDRKMLARINRLIDESTRDPAFGIGKPEPLKHALSGFWSRRIDSEHRLIYQVREQEILIAKCRFHYD